MDMIQYILLAVGVLIALSSYAEQIKSMLGNLISLITPKKVEPTPDPVVIIRPTPNPTPTVPEYVPPVIEDDFPEPLNVDIPEEELQTVRLVDIIIEWERLVDLLERSDMSECNVDMKNLLIKMATEYRSELSEITKKAEKNE